MKMNNNTEERRLTGMVMHNRRLQIPQWCVERFKKLQTDTCVSFGFQLKFYTMHFLLILHFI